ncbi:MAG: hypothetical protein ACRECN_00395 [Methylocella sp.]
MPRARNSKMRLLQDFAAAVGAKIKIDYIGPGVQEYALINKHNEMLVRGGPQAMLSAIEAYYGAHRSYEDARREFDRAVTLQRIRVKC